MSLRRLGFASALVAALLLASTAYAAEPFAARVDRAYAIVRDAQPVESASEAARVASEVHRQIPPAEVVTFRGRRIEVDSSVADSLATQLDGAGTDDGRREAAERLEAHLASLARAVVLDGPAVRQVSPDATRLRALVDRHRGDARSDLVERLAAWVERVGDFLERLFQRVGSTPGVRTGWDVFMWLAIAALVLVLAFTLYRLVVRLRAAFSSVDEPAPSPLDGSAPVVAAAEGLPPDALAYAEELAAMGRFREAVRALFGGAARRLVERGVVAQTRTRTDGELLAEVAAAAPRVHAPLAPLTQLFERAWYGHVDPGEPGFGEARARYAEALAAADASGKGA